MKKYLSIMSRKAKVKYAGAIVLAFISSLLASICLVRLDELYANISNGNIDTIDQGILVVVKLGLIYLFAECITICHGVVLDCIIAFHESEVREHIIEKLLKMPLSYYFRYLYGKKTAQLKQEVAGFSQLIQIMCNDIFAIIPIAACPFIQVFLNAPRIMAKIMLLYLILTFIISAFQIRSQNGIREISEKERLLPNILSISQIEKKHHRYMGTFDFLKQLCKISFQIFLLVASILLISNGKMSADSGIKVYLLFQQLSKSIDEAHRSMDETVSSVIKVKALLEATDSSSNEIFDITEQLYR